MLIFCCILCAFYEHRHAEHRLVGGIIGWYWLETNDRRSTQFSPSGSPRDSSFTRSIVSQVSTTCDVVEILPWRLVWINENGAATRWWKSLRIEYVSRFDTIPACDGQTDGHTDILGEHNLHYALYHLVKIGRGHLRCSLVTPVFLGKAFYPSPCTKFRLYGLL